MFTPPSPASDETRDKKNIIERKRWDKLKRKVDELRELTNDNSTTKKLCFAAVLHRVAQVLNGQDASVPISLALPSSPDGIIRSRKDAHSERQKHRNAVEVAGYAALQKYVFDKGLSTKAQLSRSDLLDIIIAEVKKMKHPAVAPVVDPQPVPQPVPPVLSLEQIILFYSLLNIPLSNPALPVPVGPAQPLFPPVPFTAPQFLFQLPSLVDRLPGYNSPNVTPANQ